MAKPASANGPVRFRVVGIEDGMMLRQLLGKRLKVTPAIAAEIVRAGGAYVGPVRMCVPTVRVTEGERVTVYPRAAQIVAIDPAMLTVLHRDAQCVIVEKPHGVPAAATRAATRPRHDPTSIPSPTCSAISRRQRTSSATSRAFASPTAPRAWRSRIRGRSWSRAT